MAIFYLFQYTFSLYLKVLFKSKSRQAFCCMEAEQQDSDVRGDVRIAERSELVQQQRSLGPAVSPFPDTDA